MMINTFPNPCSDQITFQFEQTGSEMALTIYDLNGDIVYEKSGLRSEMLVVETKYLLPGIYFYRMSDNTYHEDYKGEIVVGL